MNRNYIITGILLLIVISISIAIFISKKPTIDIPNQLGLTVIDTKKNTVDSDGDGVPNWLEEISGTDPNDETSLPDNKLSSIIDPKTSSGIQTIYDERVLEQLKSINDSNEVSEGDIIELSDKISVSFNTILENEKVDLNKLEFYIETDDTTFEFRKEFAIQFLEILSPIFFDAEEPQTVTLSNFINKQTTSGSLQELVLSYESIIDKLLKLRVPERSTDLYLILLEDLERIRFSLDELIKNPTSPITLLRVYRVFSDLIIPPPTGGLSTIVDKALVIIEKLGDN